MKLFKKIIQSLQYIILILGIVFSIYCFIKSFIYKGTGFFGPLGNLLLFASSFVYILYTLAIAGLLGMFYSFIENLMKKK